jgi:hypothetical protein
VCGYAAGLERSTSTWRCYLDGASWAATTGKLDAHLEVVVVMVFRWCRCSFDAEILNPVARELGCDGGGPTRLYGELGNVVQQPAWILFCFREVACILARGTSTRCSCRPRKKKKWVPDREMQMRPTGQLVNGIRLQNMSLMLK